jgi:hypothetical protein
LRGLLIVLMTVTHIPGTLSQYCNGPFGIVSSAEGFVLLAACLCGAIYSTSLERDGFECMRAKVWRRAGRVYTAHVLVLLPVAAAAVAFAPWSRSLANHFHPLLADPLAAFLLIPFLLHNPPLFDVLPLYVLCLLFTPWCLQAGLRHGWPRLLVLATLLWGLAQIGRGVRTATFPPAFLPVHPPVHPGHFDWLAWGGLWICGLALGATLQAGRPRPGAGVPAWRGALPLAAVIVALGLLVRHGLWPAAWFHPDVYLYMDKWTLGPLRVLNLIALTYLLWRWNPHPPAWLAAPCARIGRHSLVLFSLHLPLVVLAHALLTATALNAGLLQGLACGKRR